MLLNGPFVTQASLIRLPMADVKAFVKIEKLEVSWAVCRRMLASHVSNTDTSHWRRVDEKAISHNIALNLSSVWSSVSGNLRTLDGRSKLASIQEIFSCKSQCCWTWTITGTQPGNCYVRQLISVEWICHQSGSTSAAMVTGTVSTSNEGILDEV